MRVCWYQVQKSYFILQKILLSTPHLIMSHNLNLNMPAIEKYRKSMLSWFKQRLFLLTKLPAALFMGFRVKDITTEKCEVTLPYGWRSKNPFKSIYFAAQAAAAELSTGALCIMALQGQPPVSMLVASVQGDFLKKATKKVTFVCSDTDKIYNAIAETLKTGEGVTISVESVGTQEDGVIVSRFQFTWSFKAKSGKQ
jgi:acyl-coenzyme A thioesterase PaaI-like protein